MTELRRRILNPDISAQERDLLCEASFGKPFSEMVDKLRFDDLKEGVESRRYLILSVSGISGAAAEENEEPMAVEIRFTFSSPFNSNTVRSLSLLYTVTPLIMSEMDIHMMTSRAELYATLYGTDAYRWAISEIRKLQSPF